MPNRMLIPIALAAISVVFAQGAVADDVMSPVTERFAGGDGQETPDFQKHVVPLLGRLGCNGRACHGSFQGRGGFRLSLFGYDFKSDHAALLDDESPRVDRDNYSRVRRMIGATARARSPA